MHVNYMPEHELIIMFQDGTYWEIKYNEGDKFPVLYPRTRESIAKGVRVLQGEPVFDKNGITPPIPEEKFDDIRELPMTAEEQTLITCSSDNDHDLGPSQYHTAQFSREFTVSNPSNQDCAEVKRLAETITFLVDFYQNNKASL